MVIVHIEYIIYYVHLVIAVACIWVIHAIKRHKQL